MIPDKLNRLSLGELLRWCLALAAIAYFGDIAGASHRPDALAPAALCASLFGAGAFNVAAWLMILGRAAQPLPDRPASLVCIMLALLFGLVCALPLGLTLAPTLAVLGLTLRYAPSLPRNGREIALLLLALSASWGSGFARFLAVAAARVDAPIAAAIAGLAGISTQVHGNLIGAGTFSIEILPGCASTTPLPTVLLAYVVVVLHRGRRFSKTDLPWLLASLLLSIALTELRLALMIPSQPDWNFWHNGEGVTMYEIAALAAATACPWFARPLSRRRQPALQPAA